MTVRTAAIGTREDNSPALGRFYAGAIRASIVSGFQYRASQYMFMIGMIAEPVIYIVVWSTIAREHGGAIKGFTPADFAAYFIVWTLVRNMNLFFSVFAWEDRVRRGTFSAWLLRPIHPIHYDLASFAGWKVVQIVLWLPLAAALTLVFQPALHPSVAEIVVFSIAIWGAFLVRAFLQWALGLLSFWTTRVSAFFQAYFFAELVFSGRLLPLKLAPSWMREVATYLPFKWSFGFPIEALVGDLGRRALLTGLMFQAGWACIGVAICALIWQRAVGRYTAVGS
jgi:ABC-2 type transport system permease protein